jgi:WD40 repeat protein
MFQSTNFVYEGHRRSAPLAYSEVGWSFDGRFVATLVMSNSFERSLHVWAPGSQSHVTHTSHGAKVNALAWHPRESILATAGSDGTVQIADIPRIPRLGKHVVGEVRFSHQFNQETRQRYSGVTGTAEALAWSQGGSMIASIGTPDQYVHIWDAKSGTERAKFHYLPSGMWTRKVRWLLGDSSLAIAHATDVRLVSATSGDEVATLWHPDSGTGSVFDVSCCPANDRIAWLNDGERRRVIVAHARSHDMRVMNSVPSADDSGGVPTALAWYPSGRLAVGDAQGSVHMLDPDTASILASITVASCAVRAIAFAPDGSKIATVTADGAVTIARLAA